jgi:hypothetical protein
VRERMTPKQIKHQYLLILARYGLPRVNSFAGYIKTRMAIGKQQGFIDSKII